MESPPVDMDRLVRWRRSLHAHPDLSGSEAGTARRVTEFLQAHAGGRVLTGLGGHGVAVDFDSRRPGPTILLRADLDALPLEESTGTAWRSRKKGAAHLCGHDGHITMLTGLAEVLTARPPRRGRAVLLFQPAEETGTGAARVIKDPAFREFGPDMAFGLHNLPGYAAGRVVVRPGPFAAASRGLVVRLQGRSAHAGEPENGLSPAAAVARLLREIPELPQRTEITGFGLATPVHARLGEAAFGTAPGEAVVMATLRTHTDDDMERLFAAGEALARRAAAETGLGLELEAVEDFPATVNDPGAVQAVVRAAEAAGLSIEAATEPFRWSEDFAHFGRLCPAALFGLGAGEQVPRLHNPDYDFPDRLIPAGVAMWAALCRDLLGTQNHGG